VCFLLEQERGKMKRIEIVIVVLLAVAILFSAVSIIMSFSLGEFENVSFAQPASGGGVFGNQGGNVNLDIGGQNG
jgi:flagellar basal body-associated protein FliL